MNIFYEYWYHALGKDSLLSSSHTHEDTLEIIQMLADGGQVLIGDKIYPMTAGALYLIDGRDTHCTHPAEDATYLRNKLIFSARHLFDAADALGLKRTVEALFGKSGRYCVLTDEDAARVDGIFKSIFEACESRNEERMLKCWSDFFELLAIANHSNTAHDDPVDSSNEMIDQILSYINEHIMEELTLDVLSRELHLDKYYLCHYFKDKTSLTVMEYITERRINSAKRLLLYTSMSITEIAGKCGYASASYFAQSFKRYVGVSPVAFRKAAGNELL